MGRLQIISSLSFLFVFFGILPSFASEEHEFIRAAREGHKENVKELIKNGRNTPIRYSVKSG